MTDATLLWSIWQALLQSFAWAFTRPGHRRFAEWVTALALNAEEHTITQSTLAIERPDDWKAMESFAEYGAWRAEYVTRSLTRLVEKAPGRTWHSKVGWVATQRWCRSDRYGTRPIAGRSAGSRPSLRDCLAVQRVNTRLGEYR